MSDNNNNSNTRPVPANDPGSIPLQISEDDAATLVSRDISCDDGDFSVMTPMPTVLHRPTVSRGGDSVARPNTSSRNAAAAANVNASNNSIREDETNTIPNQEGHHDTDESELVPSRQQQQQDIDGAVEETASQNRPNGFAASSYDYFETALEEDARAKAAAGKTTAANSRTATDGDAKQKGKTGLLVDGDGAASTASSKDGKLIDGDGPSSSAVAVAASSVASQFSDEPASRGTSVPASSTTSRTSTTPLTAQNLSSHPGAYSIDNPLYNNNQNNTANNDNDDPPSRALSEQESLLLVQASLVQESSVGTNIMRQTYGELVQASPILELPPQAQDASSENVVISRRSIKLAALIGCFMLIALAVGIGVVAAVSGGDDDDDDDDGSNDISTFSLENSSTDSDADNPTASPSVSTFVTVGSDDSSLLPTISPSKITEEDTTVMPTMVSSEEEDLEETTLAPTINNDTEIPLFTTLVPTTSALSESSGFLSNATINATLDEVSDLTDLIPAAVAELSTASPSPALPTFAPSEAPTTLQPSEAPTTLQPSGAPTSQPTVQPSLAPSLAPSLLPSLFPTTTRPTTRPTFAPTKPPTLAPTPRPTLRPTQRPPRPTNPNNNPAPGPPPPNNPNGGGNNGGSGGGGQGGMQRALEEVNRLHTL